MILCSGSAAGKLWDLSTDTLLNLLICQHKQSVTWQSLFMGCLSSLDTMFKDASMDMLKPSILQTPDRLAAQQLQNIMASDAEFWNEMVLEEGAKIIDAGQFRIYKSVACDKP